MFEEKDQVETPEHVLVEFEIAGPFSRLAAGACDMVLIALVLAVAGLALVLVAGTGALSSLGDAVTAGLILGAAIVVWGYFPFFEWLMDGQTPGKRSIGIRVARQDSAPLDLRSILLRNIVRIVDMQPGLLYGVGLVSMIVTKRCLRLGDMAAGTWVVRERKSEALYAATAKRARGPAVLGVTAASAPGGPGRLTPEEHRLAEQFLGRRRGLSADVRLQVARNIAGPIQRRLGATEEDPEGFLLEEHRKGTGRSLV